MLAGIFASIGLVAGACGGNDESGLNSSGGGDDAQLCVKGQCRDFAPASPCTTCPCTNVCNDQLGGNNNSCCPGLGGGTQPICVEGSNNCP
ncbi:MAG: hypothetical protein HS104_19955 [Polyangiaceae bacterium]|nr:hypothetical protein [Polyangiaceae bacterium]MBK8998571.1 hypothetical protein [Myxococcales bacterium]